MSSATPDLLDVAELDVRFGARAVLDGVSLHLAPGEFVGLVGPNGAGKTTLLRAIAGMVPARSGRVMLEGRRLDLLDPARIARVIAQVPQSTTIDFGFACLEIVLMGRHPHLGRFEIEGPEDHRIAAEAMRGTETAHLASRPITLVSGGERQRVLAACALAQQPRLLLLDEPTANLDVLHQLRLLDLVRGLVRERGLAALAAIHDLELAARYCDRLLLLKDGRKIAEGGPAEVLTSERMAEAFGVHAVVRAEPLTGGLGITVLAAIPAEPAYPDEGGGMTARPVVKR